MQTTTRRHFLTRALAVAGLAPLVARAAAGPSLPVPAQPQAIPCGQPLPPPQRVYEAQGVAVKVPSNRTHLAGFNADGTEWRDIVYLGPWDGTFRLEYSCTNPAYVLADLYGRTGAQVDWVVAPKTWHRMPTKEGPFGYGPPLNWQMIYDYGRWCDEVVEADGVGEMIRGEKGSITWPTTAGSPRFTVSLRSTSPTALETSRQVLRMHCLHWQSTDPRYRTSYPGIAQPEDLA